MTFARILLYGVTTLICIVVLIRGEAPFRDISAGIIGGFVLVAVEVVYGNLQRIPVFKLLVYIFWKICAAFYFVSISN